MTATLLLVIRLGLSAALYAFLGWAFWLLWRDLKSQARQSSVRQVPRLTVVLTGLQEETTCHFDYSPVTIGRDPACECPIDDRTVSNHHAQFSFHHNQWWLTDLGSTNGTILNSQLVTEAVVLMSGDQIQCGQVGLVISMDQESGERAFGVQSSRGSA